MKKILAISMIVLFLISLNTVSAEQPSVLKITINAKADTIYLSINGIPLEKYFKCGGVSKGEFERFKADLKELLKQILEYSDKNDAKLSKKFNASLEHVADHIYKVLKEHRERIDQICVVYENFKDAYNQSILTINNRFAQMSYEINADFKAVWKQVNDNSEGLRILEQKIGEKEQYSQETDKELSERIDNLEKKFNKEISMLKTEIIILLLFLTGIMLALSRKKK
ncbi:hypothetical protein DRN58_07920 [Thermococci archaeon]|nr:MAG: hypothetical protein DRN58_07920 [Thermococci archaeon]